MPAARPGDEPRANRAGTEPRANITDPDVRVMRNQKGYVAGYNGQAVVTADQVIVGAMLSQHPVDRTLLHPLLDQCRDQLSAARIRPKLRTVLADAGYVSEENFARADQDKLRLLAPLAKDPARPGGRSAKRTRHLDQYPATGRAIRRLRHPRGREDYKMRARTVEPVFGQLKTCQKLTTMSRRGLAACESEWLLACTAHNLRKLYRHRVQGLRSKACHLRPEPKIAQNRHPRAVSHSRISGLTPPRGLCATPGLCIATLWGNRPPLPRRGSSVTATERP